jgi:hypothetical protein
MLPFVKPEAENQRYKTSFFVNKGFFFRLIWGDQRVFQVQSWSKCSAWEVCEVQFYWLQGYWLVNRGKDFKLG